jgi:uncharacterized membrane protein (Fun14 family)
VTQIGLGGVGGFLVGYAFKKFAKVVAFVVGAVFIFLQLLAYYGVIQINYGALFSVVEKAFGGFQSGGFLTGLFVNIPFSGSFVAGTYLGLKAG